MIKTELASHRLAQRVGVAGSIRQAKKRGDEPALVPSHSKPVKHDLGHPKIDVHFQQFPPAFCAVHLGSTLLEALGLVQVDSAPSDEAPTL